MGMLIDQDLLFPAEEHARAIARSLYAGVKALPIVSPHGHTDPRWYAPNEPFPDPARLLIAPDHYIYRMLFSQGVRLEDLRQPVDGPGPAERDRQFEILPFVT
jgi:glucuronate isomerase